MGTGDLGMYEIRSVRQDDSEFLLRWFTSLECDLYVWERSDSRQVERFQFYYNKQSDERMVEWTRSGGFWFARVDEGEYRNPFKASPVLQSCDDVDLTTVLRIFKKHASDIDKSIRDFVIARIQNKIGQLTSF